MDVEVDGVGDGGREGGRAERERRPLERVRATRSERIFNTTLRTAECDTRHRRLRLARGWRAARAPAWAWVPRPKETAPTGRK